MSFHKTFWLGHWFRPVWCFPKHFKF